jgi:hypothetical protein
MILDHKELGVQLDGMYWDHGDFAINLKSADKNAVVRAVSEFKRVLPSFCANVLAVLEKRRLNVVQTEMILHGVSPVGVDEYDINLVSRIGQTVSRVCELIVNGSFTCSSSMFELIHQCLSTKTQSAVSVQSALEFLNAKITDPKERGAAAFLYLCRQQVFDDLNNLSALIFMNGILINEGFYPLFIKERDSAEFKIRYIEFEHSGRASDVMHFLVMTYERNAVRHEKLSRFKSKSKDKARLSIF